MKIVLVCFNAPWDIIGGIEIHSWELAKAMASMGNEVHLVYVEGCHSKTRLKTKDGVYLHGIELLSGLNNKYKRFLFNIYDYILYKKIQDIGSFDILHSQEFDGIPMTLRTKIDVVTFHTAFFRNVLSSCKHVRKLPSTILHLLWHVKSKNLFKYTRRVIAVSDKVKDDLKKWYSVDATVIPNGVNPPKKISKAKARRELGIEHFDKIILFLSRVTKEKGPHKLLDIIKEEKDLGLLIGGTGPFIKELKMLTVKYKLEDRVKILGYVPEEKKKYLFSAADCFALPSNQVEGQPIVVLEALSYGLPTYVTDPNWVPRYLRRYVISGDLKEGIMKALSLKRVKAKVMTWIDVAKKTLEIYYNVLEDI